MSARVTLTQLWTMTSSDLRQRFRDRSVLIFALVVPLALMVVLDLTLGGSEAPGFDAVTVAVSAPAGDASATALLAPLHRVEGLDVTVEEVPTGEVRGRARSGSATLGVVVPGGFGDAIAAGEGPVVEVVQGQDAGLEADVFGSVLQGTLERLAAGAATARAGAAAGLPSERLGALAQQAAAAPAAVSLAQGRAAAEQLSPSGALVAGQAGLFLLFTVGFGVLSLVAEREQGTMTRLLSMPLRPGLVVVAKGLVSYVLGVAATTVLLAAGALLFDVSFGSPAAVAVLVLGVVAAGTSLMFVVARLARTAEQAGAIQSILAVVLGVAGGAFFPLSAPGLAGTLLDLNPIAAFTRGLGITAGGGGPGDVGGSVAVLAGFAVVMLLLARLLPDRGRRA